MGHYLQITLIVIYAIVAADAAWVHGDWWKALYWIGAATITLSIMNMDGT